MIIEAEIKIAKLEKCIAELEAELASVKSKFLGYAMGSELSDDDKDKRITELEAKLEEVKHDKEGWYNADGYAEIVKRLDAENKRQKETIEILKQALDHAKKDKTVF